MEQKLDEAKRPVARKGEGGRGDRARGSTVVSRLILVVLSVSLLVLPAGCRRAEGFDAQLNAVVDPYHFSILRWELGHILERSRPPQSGAKADTDAYLQPVKEYFALVDEIWAAEWEINAIASGGRQGDLRGEHERLAKLQARKEALRSDVEWILGQQVRAAFNEEGIFNPVDRYVWFPHPFPPLNFRLTPPPTVLIVSPRERIESMREVMLVPEVALDVRESLESQVDALGVSSLVEGLGGFGATYPSFVSDDSSLRWTITVIAEEWLHQYLVFTPLGFMYLLDGLGIKRDYDIATINETVAGIVATEIADIVYDAHYSPKEPPSPAPSPPESEPTAPPRFDYIQEMRQTRLTVDRLLDEGKVEEAEQFMEERRKVLASEGYYIRKLNQAYFAFYGTYANDPTSVSPIGTDLKELRTSRASLREFLNRAAQVTSWEELQEIVQ